MSADAPGRREVAHRLFAAEFDDATLSYSESDEERAPNYVVTPTGLRVNRLFVAGVLTEIESVNEEVLRARVVDPSGAFVVYAGQYQPDQLAFLERTDPPAFVAVTGKARTFQPEDSDRVFTSVRPESTNLVDADTRDRAVVTAAEATLRRVAIAAEAIEAGLEGDALETALLERGVDPSLAAGLPLALDHYGTTTAYLEAVRRLAVDALEVVAGDRQEVRALDRAPDEGGEATLGPVPGGEDVTDLTGVEPAAADAPTPEADSGGAASGPSGGSATGDGPETAGSSDASTEAEAGSETVVEADATVAESDAAADAPGVEAETTPTDASATADAAEETDDDARSDADDARSTDESDETTGGSLGDFDDGGLGDFDAGDGDEDDLYELDEDERRAVEEEYGTEFETGTEVDPAGEADVDVPTQPVDASVESAEATEPAGDDDAEGTAGAASTGEPPSEEATATEESDDGTEAADVDLEEAVVTLMADLDDGDGAPREEVVAAAADDHGVDPEEAEDAIQDALMDGRCYEPSEDRLKAI